MRYSTTAIILIVFILVFSIFVANFANIISTDQNLVNKLNKDQNGINEWTKNQRSLQINDEHEHLMWFIQISDLHISIFHDKERVEQLKQFVNQTIDIVQPSVVLASGDLTDAKEANQLGSRQFKEEWKIYKNLLDASNIEDKTIWLDIRGNHDNFNVPYNSSQNYFNKYSIQGGKHQRSYLHQVKVGNDTYSFIAVDACLEPGPKRPFNFIGLLDVDEASLVIDLAEEARSRGGNYTIWFGHYPTSCILAPGTGGGGVRSIIGKYDESIAYLCGHLHTMGGMLHNMYTLQKAGFLELELGDWKLNRLFRVAAFDHGLFSFVDVKHNDWPIILVTNPKNVLFNIPNKENPLLQQESTHIRILIFSPSEVVNCKIKIDEEEWRTCDKKSQHLYVVKWSTEKYSFGIHKLQVMAETKDGKRKITQQSFSLDGSRTNFNLFARFVLMADACKVFQVLFSISLLLCVLPLCILRIFHELVRTGRCKKPRIRNQFIKSIVRKFWVLSSIDCLLIPLLVYCLYITIGPWSIGEIIDEHIGVIFAWGIFVDDTFLPGSLTYLYGFLQLTICQIPLIIIFANMADERLRVESGTLAKKRGIISKCLFHLPFTFIILVEIALAYYFWVAYGTLALIVGPFRTWSVIMNLVLWYLVSRLSGNSLKSAATVWQMQTY